MGITDLSHLTGFTVENSQDDFAGASNGYSPAEMQAMDVDATANDSDNGSAVSHTVSAGS